MKEGEPIDPETIDVIDALAADLRDAGSAVALTGAGVSTASGIPSFRGEDGIWETEFDPEAFHVRRFERDPEGFWTDRIELYERMYPASVAPNPAHEALADLEAAGVLDAVITQNTDGLHAAAGSETVIELHGSNSRVVCHRCGRTDPADPIRERVVDGELPPECPDCGGAYKPDVVLFGELLDPDVLERARAFVAGSDVLVVAGSSLVVDPAGSLPARQRGGSLAIVNYDRTPFDGTADYVLREDVTEVLPAIAERVAQNENESS